MQYFGKKEKCDTNEILYLIALAIFLIASVWELTYTWAVDETGSATTVTSILKLLACLIIMIKLIRQSYEKGYLFLILIFGGVLAIACYVSNVKMLIIYAIVCCGAYGCNYKRAMKVAAFVQGGILLLVVLLSKCGVMEDYLFVFQSRERHGLGFSWCTTAPVLFFFFILCYSCIRGNRMKFFEPLILAAINIFFFEETNTRMTFYLAMVFLLLLFLNCLWKKGWAIWGKFRKVLPVIPVLAAILSIVMTAVYNPDVSWMKKLNSLLSKRLALGKSAMDEYGISIFGKAIKWIGFNINDKYPEGYNYVDCSYVQILLTYGIIALVLIVALYVIAIKKFSDTNAFWIVAALAFACLHSMTEPRLFNLTFNIIPIIALCRTDGAGDAGIEIN